MQTAEIGFGIAFTAICFGFLSLIHGTWSKKNEKLGCGGSGGGNVPRK